MNSLRFRSALLLLIISFFLTSGAVAAFAELLQDGGRPPCCDVEKSGSGTPAGLPCSVPDCHCLACMTFVVPAHSGDSVAAGVGIVSLSTHVFDAPPSGYVKSIDYPPESFA